jgi:hypothetical protein
MCWGSPMPKWAEVASAGPSEVWAVPASQGAWMARVSIQDHFLVLRHTLHLHKLLSVWRWVSELSYLVCSVCLGACSVSGNPGWRLWSAHTQTSFPSPGSVPESPFAQFPKLKQSQFLLRLKKKNSLSVCVLELNKLSKSQEPGRGPAPLSGWRYHVHPTVVGTTWWHLILLIPVLGMKWGPALCVVLLLAFLVLCDLRQ